MAEVEMDKQGEIITTNNTEDDLPQKILEKYSSDLQVQLIKGYRILQVLMYYLNNSPFFEKPENKKYGGKLYYDVIKNPMWFNEIKRKMFNAEYNSLVEIIKDMRLVFENCYYFWGPKTAMSEQCVKMERLMEKQLLSLPKDLKNMCSLEETHGKNEDEVVTKNWNRYRNKGKSCSNLMLRTWRKRRISESKDYEVKSDLANCCDYKTKIDKWEKEALRLTDHVDLISTTAELPQISLFFLMIGDAFDVKPYCQIEIERMFLMSRYSLALRQILTILLTGEYPLDLPSYENLMDKLKDTINEWYSLYEKEDQDDDKTCQTIGIEPEFFKIIGDSNPMLTSSYEDLDYRKKAAIVKALCDCFVHKRQDIEEILSKADEAEFAAEIIGRDKLGYGYLFFAKFLDFRLYKQKLTEDVITANKETLQDVDNDKRTLKKFFPRGPSNFELVADSTEKLRCLIDDLIYSDVETSKKDSKSSNYDIIDSLRELENRIFDNEDVYIERSNNVRMKMFAEWKDLYLPNQPDFFSEDEELNDTGRDSRSSSIDKENGTKSPTSEINFVDANCCAAKQDGSVDHSENESNHSNPESKDDSNIEPAKENNEEMTFETDIEDFHIKTEIKDEPQTDDTLFNETVLTSSRRRRSSVPSYNVFDKKLFFSDESGSESPDEIYTEDDDSDDDWDVPKKKSKKAKNKLTRQLKINAEDSNNKRKRKVSSKNESNAQQEKTSGTIVESKMEPDCVIKKDPDEIDKNDDDKNKSGLKIKVVDLAKLQKCENGVASNKRTIESALVPRIVSQGTLQALSQNTIMDSVPVINNVVSSQGVVDTFSNVGPTFTIVGQPQAFSNAYIITTNQNPFQASGTAQYQVQPLSSPVYRPARTAMAHTPQQNSNLMPTTVNTSNRFINAPSINKMVYVNQNAPIRYSSLTPSKQMPVRGSSNFNNKPNRIASNPITPLRKIVSVSGKANYSNNMTSKLGRNVTVTPNVITKTNDGRNSFKEIEGSIGFRSTNGTLQYVVNLANGTHVPLTNVQVQKLRDGNNGALPLKLKIPVPSDVAEKIEPCVVIDD